MFDLSIYKLDISSLDIPTIVVFTFVICAVALITQIIFAFIIFRKLARLARLAGLDGLENDAYSEQDGELDPILDKLINHSEKSIEVIGITQKGEEELFNNPAIVGRVLTVNQKGFMQDVWK